tara:strand:- start:405 stop:881 length:477 start_codon:yes stop_codon:yes gene_type:complete
MTTAVSAPLIFESYLDARYRDELEDLFYFNSNQAVVREEMERAIDLFGIPEIVEASGRLTFQLRGGQAVQTLFALEEISGEKHLAGVIIYARTDDLTLSLIHIAVSEAEFLSEQLPRNRLTSAMFDCVFNIARKIKGLERIHFLYGKKSQYIKLRKSS